MYTVKIIKNKTEYQKAMGRLSELMTLEPALQTQAANELELLALVIAHYESKHITKPIVSPVEAILFRMEQQGLKPKDLEPYIGARSKVSEILNGKRPLSLTMIKKLHTGLNLPLEVLVGDYVSKSFYKKAVSKKHLTYA